MFYPKTDPGAAVAGGWRGHRCWLRSTGRRLAVLLQSTDAGLTWAYFSTLGPRSEPAVVRFSPTEMLAQ